MMIALSITWLAPAALAGIGLIALPIAIHLLVRQPARELRFPSLRFLQETQLASFRRRTIQDPWLLLCRCAVVAAAAIALAGPMVQSDARTAAFASRLSRAIVATGTLDDASAAELSQGTFKASVFTRARLSDALSDAIRWLDAQPPSSREIVIAAPMRRGNVTAADVALIPKEIGVRFHPLPGARSGETMSTLTLREGVLTRIDRAVTMTADTTKVADGAQTRVADDLVTISARSEDAVLARAALRAALGAGVPWVDFSTPVVVIWEGGSPTAPPGARVVHMPVPRIAASAADAVYAALVRGTPQPQLPEPVAIAPQDLDRWTRSPGPVATNAPLSDEGDRRWVWIAVLILLVVEALMRRSINAREVVHEEARVA